MWERWGVGRGEETGRESLRYQARILNSVPPWSGGLLSSPRIQFQIQALLFNALDLCPPKAQLGRGKKFILCASNSVGYSFFSEEVPICCKWAIKKEWPFLIYFIYLLFLPPPPPLQGDSGQLLINALYLFEELSFCSSHRKKSQKIFLQRSSQS